jgi:DNA polymerase II large subunit
MSREELAFKIAKDIIQGNFGKMEERESADQAVRTALAIITEGITAAPIDGISRVEIKRNIDSTRYLAIYFAGPIRSAGGTEQALTLVVGDYIRKLLGLKRYEPTEKEIARFVEEIRLFEREIARFQYHISDEELTNVLKHIPVEVTGTQTDPIEVSSFRNLPRIETNRVRGGALRVLNDGVVGRSAKVWIVVRRLGINGWDWLKNIRDIKTKKTAGFMEDVIAGRPVFSFPSRRGGFRLRYGRSRNTGLAAVGIHPATMKVLSGFLAAGTQIRLEGPGKAGVVLPVDTIEPPIVRLRDGSVVSVSLKNFRKIENEIEKILFLGDILVGFGDFLYNNKMYPSGFTEEWWTEELREAISSKSKKNSNTGLSDLDISPTRIGEILADPFSDELSVEEAIKLSRFFDIPLHPRFTFFWTGLKTDELILLRKWLLTSKIGMRSGLVYEIIGILENSIKNLLERIRIPHEKIGDSLRIVGDNAHAFSVSLGYKNIENIDIRKKSVLEVIHGFSDIFLREKAPTFIGARMGRPEKAKRRQMKPLVHALFPVGLAGGSRRNLITALRNRRIEVDLIRRLCFDCNISTFLQKCPDCGSKTSIQRVCPICKRLIDQDSCPVCLTRTKCYEKQQVNIREILLNSFERLNYTPTIVKGVRGLINETKTPEIIEKGILRARHDLSVFKDGTTRFDSTNAPLTHFKPVEIGTSVDRLKQLGYTHDYKGIPLVDSNQICELKIQDIIIPDNGAKYFVKITKFLDRLLEAVYDLSTFYNVNGKEELVGHMVVGMAPHISVGVLGRIIGFTRLNLCYAHPFWHSAKRRDCDGDEDSIILTLDVLLNFSKSYLPTQIGGIMDAPLFIIPIINPQELQRQAHNMDVSFIYPLSFYKETLANSSPQDVIKLVDVIEQRLDTPLQFEKFGYTIPVSNINLGNKQSTYSRLDKMVDKLNGQLILAERIEAVDAQTVAQKVLTTHFIRDIMGNLRAFTTQGFRCKTCNSRYRRLPLLGKCSKCNGKLTMTVYRGGIEKYLEIAKTFVEKYKLNNYYAQRLSLIEEEIASIFDGEDSGQLTLKDFS